MLVLIVPVLGGLTMHTWRAVSKCCVGRAMLVVVVIVVAVVPVVSVEWCCAVGGGEGE